MRFQVANDFGRVCQRRSTSVVSLTVPPKAEQATELQWLKSWRMRLQPPSSTELQEGRGEFDVVFGDRAGASAVQRNPYNREFNLHITYNTMKNTSKAPGPRDKGGTHPNDVSQTEVDGDGPMVSDDPVFAKYGEPFLIDAKGKVSLNERAVAVKCATTHLVKYNPTLKAYERYDDAHGLWTDIHEVNVRRLLGDLLIQLGEQHNQTEFVHRNKNSQFNSLCKMLQPYQAETERVDTSGLVHLCNGVLDLRANKPKLLKHDPRYAFKRSPSIRYDEKARCPKFLNDLLGAALDKDDRGLIQKYCGSILLGPNTCHGIMVVRGTPGGGKSTLVSVIEKIIGEENVAYLRTKHLNGRFESSAFIGKRVLVGKDVPGDTLAEKGARLLKSLVGGDLLQAEIKYNPAKQMMRGDYHVIIASNNRLRIALDGDEEAWRRRLLVVDFEKPKPKKAIPKFDELLVKEEASGILNWLVEGAAAYREDMTKRGMVTLTAKQQERVTALLSDSDSVRSFVDQRVKAEQGRDVAGEELLLGYYDQCEKQRWTPVGERAFQKQVPDILLQRFKACRRNDVMRGGKAVRGFKHLSLHQ